MAQLILRTVRRALTGEELWNGNRERISDVFSRDANKSLILFAWQQFPHDQAYYHGCTDDPRWSHLEFVQLQTPSAVHRWLEGLEGR